MHHYNCKNCSTDFKTGGDLPRGAFDSSVIREVVSLYFKRMSLDTIRITLEERYGLKISCNTVQSILETGCERLEPVYCKINRKSRLERLSEWMRRHFQLKEGQDGRGLQELAEKLNTLLSTAKVATRYQRKTGRNSQEFWSLTDMPRTERYFVTM